MLAVDGGQGDDRERLRVLRLQQLRDELAAQYASAFALVCFVAVNGAQVHDLAQPLDDGSEVAFMAKFSGG